MFNVSLSSCHQCCISQHHENKKHWEYFCTGTVNVPCSLKPENLPQETNLEGGEWRCLWLCCSIRFSSGGDDRWFSRDPLPVFSAGCPCEQFWQGQGCPLFDVVYPAFPLPTTVSPILQDTPKNGSGEAVMAYDTPEPCKFPSLDSCKKRFLWTPRKLILFCTQSLVLSSK